MDIETDWEQLYGTFKSVNIANGNEPVAVQLLTDPSDGSQHSAQRVIAWAQRNCNIDLGPVPTPLVPPNDAITTITTVAG